MRRVRRCSIQTRVQAAGSSLLARVTHFLVLDALRLAGLAEAAAVQVFPLATGMAMTSAFLACAALRPDPAAARSASYPTVLRLLCGHVQTAPCVLQVKGALTWCQNAAGT